MTNSNHVDIVKSGREAVDTHNRKVADDIDIKNGVIIPIGLDLENANLNGETLNEIDFINTYFTLANFSNTTLIQCTFSICEYNCNCNYSVTNYFKSTDFSNAEFIQCTFKNGIFDESSFLNAKFNQCTFNDCVFDKSIFTGASFDECIFQGNSKFIDIDASGIDFSSCTFNEGFNFKKGIFKNARFNCKKFYCVEFTEVVLSKAHFEEANDLENINFNKCEFPDTDLSNANFSKLTLKNNDFSDCNLNGVNFCKSDLSGSNFSGSDLKNVNFCEATISKCNFNNAKNLAKSIDLNKTRIAKSEDVIHFEDCIRDTWEIRDWELLRKFGKLPLFGASYVAFFFFYFLTSYNKKIDIILNSTTYSINNSNILYVIELLPDS